MLILHNILSDKQIYMYSISLNKGRITYIKTQVINVTIICITEGQRDNTPFLAFLSIYI